MPALPDIGRVEYVADARVNINTQNEINTGSKETGWSVDVDPQFRSGTYEEKRNADLLILQMIKDYLVSSPDTADLKVELKEKVNPNDPNLKDHIFIHNPLGELTRRNSDFTFDNAQPEAIISRIQTVIANVNSRLKDLGVNSNEKLIEFAKKVQTGSVDVPAAENPNFTGKILGLENNMQSLGRRK